MPLVKIDVVRGARSPDELKALADTVQQVMRDHFNAPDRDRYQVLIYPGCNFAFNGSGTSLTISRAEYGCVDYYSTRRV